MDTDRIARRVVIKRAGIDYEFQCENSLFRLVMNYDMHSRGAMELSKFTGGFEATGKAFDKKFQAFVSELGKDYPYLKVSSRECFAMILGGRLQLTNGGNLHEVQDNAILKALCDKFGFRFSNKIG